MGITTIVKPIQFDFTSFNTDLYIMLGVAFWLMLLIYPFKTNLTDFKQEKNIKSLIKLDTGKLTWRGGILLLAIYGAYVWVLFQK